MDSLIVWSLVPSTIRRMDKRRRRRTEEIHPPWFPRNAGCMPST